MHRQFFERTALPLPIGKVCHRYRLVVAVILLLVDHHHVLQVRDSQRTEDHRVHDAESGGIDADPDRQGEDRCNRESGRLPQLAYRIAQILVQRLHQVPLPDQHFTENVQQGNRTLPAKLPGLYDPHEKGLSAE